MIALMVTDPANIASATRLLWVTHNLERIADRASNICRITVSTVTGQPRGLESGGD